MVPTNAKLRDSQGRTVRIQETSLHEAFELWHRYCDPKHLGLDLCTGTGVSIMAMLHLGLQGIVNERDKECIHLGVERARCYMDHLYKQGDFMYPEVGTRHHELYDGKVLYAWASQYLGRGKAPSATTLQLPPTNHPYDVPNPISDESFTKVLMSSCVVLV
jgi:hypothetical protein